MVYFPVLCHVYLCLEFWHNERSFAKCVQATGKNCKLSNKSLNQSIIKIMVSCILVMSSLFTTNDYQPISSNSQLRAMD